MIRHKRWAGPYTQTIDPGARITLAAADIGSTNAKRAFFHAAKRAAQDEPPVTAKSSSYFGLIGSFLFRSSIRLNAANSVVSVRSSRSVCPFSS